MLGAYWPSSGDHPNCSTYLHTVSNLHNASSHQLATVEEELLILLKPMLLLCCSVAFLVVWTSSSAIITVQGTTSTSQWLSVDLPIQQWRTWRILTCEATFEGCFNFCLFYATSIWCGLLRYVIDSETLLVLTLRNAANNNKGRQIRDS